MCFNWGKLFYVVQLGTKRIHKVRTRGGNIKYRAMRLDSGNFSWGSEGVSISHNLWWLLASCTMGGEDQDIPMLKIILILSRNSLNILSGRV